MNTLKRMMMVMMDMAFVFLAMNALVIVLGFFANLLVTSGHGHWTATSLALTMAIALRIFIWLLPLTVLVFFIGSLIGSETPAANQK
jgi:nitric oxide reductase large subunit